MANPVEDEGSGGCKDWERQNLKQRVWRVWKYELAKVEGRVSLGVLFA